MAHAFEAHGLPTPEIRWNPGAGPDLAPQNAFLLKLWTDLRGGAAMPGVAQIDPVAFAPALGYVNLVEPTPDGDDFVYRVFGSHVAAVFRADLTGRTMGEIATHDSIVDFIVASCRAVRMRGAPLLTRRVPPGTDTVELWERLILPFADKDGAVARIAIGAVPLDRLGRALKPAF